jgi:DNA-binding CsgD family transcriptional regulator
MSEVIGAGALLAREELTSLAVIPIKSKERVVAVLNLASRTQSEVPESTRSALETIAARIGGIVSRIGAEEALKMERENLAEANAALKVLLRHREEDRRELEESLLTNVKNLVMPYVDKLVKTRLSSDQILLVEIIESNLREIASPFLRRVSHPLVKLSPMETRVADLIRNGRNTKEIAAFLHTSVRSVRFHRESIRRKLGLKSNKVNLRSYLLSLA